MHAVSDAAPQPFILADRADADEAAVLVADFGCGAEREAARRAARSRDVGNVVHFCRWRRIGRLAGLLTGTEAGATLH